MKNILAHFIPHKRQRYETVGDYEENPLITVFSISRMKKWQHEALVFVHEIIEYLLVKHRKISIRAIDKFDIEMEEAMKGLRCYAHVDKKTYSTDTCFGTTCLSRKGVINRDEPGICERAPYHREHMFATTIEKLLATQLGVDWKEYTKTINEL